MTTTDLHTAIGAALDNLAETNQQLCDYWIAELYDLEDNKIANSWNEQTLYELEKDVMQQMSL